MSGIETNYRDDLGETDGIGERPLPDFLPPPDRLVRREDTVKVTLALSRASVVTAWVPPRSRQPEPTPPQPIPTNLATRPTNPALPR